MRRGRTIKTTSALEDYANQLERIFLTAPLLEDLLRIIRNFA
jgi:hypothetical protein